MPQLEVTTYNVQYWWGIIILFLLLILLEVFVFPLIKRSWSIRTFLMKWEWSLIKELKFKDEIVKSLFYPFGGAL
uniref:ATP synthase F0 subunit 8 n=1 Tax=Madracis mirabilis TaxID=928217 RepID=B5L5J8_MADMI|nr:ATP synthase F0 subunit 8 [Madracis myriaster]ACA84077.1 ATP synthase F0 subunit 8 [Madracis myriaster]